jgi:hypothetical protein
MRHEFTSLARVVRLALRALLLVLVAVSTAAAQPGAPLNVQASASGSTVTVTWQAPAGPVTGYVIEASLLNFGPVAATIQTTGTSFVAPNVPNGTYYIRVSAVNGGLRSAPSQVASVTTGGCTRAPDPPGTLTWSPIPAVTTVTLTWGASPGGACVPVGYLVYVGTARGASNVGVVGTTATTIAGALPPGTYYARVTAFNHTGESAPSNEQIISVVGLGVSGAWTGSVIGRSLGAQSGPLSYVFVETADGTVTATDPNRRFPPLRGYRVGNTLVLDRVDGINCENWILTIANNTIQGEARYSCGITGVPIWTVSLSRPVP